MSAGRVFGCSLLIALSFAATPGEAQDRGGRLGQRAVEQLCAECHATQKGQTRSPASSAPTFEAIAATPGMTSAALRAALNTSHRTMPNVILQPDELADIVAYILSLKPGAL